MHRLHALALATFVLPWHPPAHATAVSQHQVERILERADRLLQEGAFKEALKAFNKADKQAGGNCVDCLLGLAASSRQLGDYDEAIELADQVLAQPLDPPAEARAYNERGLALYLKAGQNTDPEVQPVQLLRDSEAALRRALAACDGAANNARFNLAWVLHRLLADRSFTGSSRENLLETTGLLREYVRREGRSDMETEGLLRYSRNSLAVLDELEAPSETASSPGAEAGEVVPPVTVFAPQPRYTAHARIARAGRVVIVEGVIDKSGNVTNVKVVKGLPGGSEWAAVDAVRRWQFKPATLNGRPVLVYHNLTVNFRE